MTPEEAINLLKDHDLNTVALVHAINSPRGEKTAARKQRASAKKLLTFFMGRPPTEAELEQATNW